MTYLHKQAMTDAWKAARTASAVNGGSVKSYFAEALRQAWSQLKNNPLARATAELIAEIYVNKNKPPVKIPAHMAAAASRARWSHTNAKMGLAYHGW